MTTLNFVKSEIEKELNIYAAKYETTVKELFFG